SSGYGACGKACFPERRPVTRPKRPAFAGRTRQSVMGLVHRYPDPVVHGRLLRHRARLGTRLLAYIRLAQITEKMIDTLDPSHTNDPPEVGASARRPTRAVAVRWNDKLVRVGGNAPVVVQSMTNTDTADAIATAIQVKDLAQAGSELVRITVNTPEAAREVPAIREQLDRMGVSVPLVGDFHYNGHKLLADFPE